MVYFSSETSLFFERDDVPEDVLRIHTLLRYSLFLHIDLILHHQRTVSARCIPTREVSSISV